MNNGEELETCDRCYNLEASGSDMSMRLEFNAIYDVDVQQKIRYIHTGLSNHCNLACRSCDSDFSSKIFQFKNPNTKVELYTINQEVSNYDSDLSELNRIRFTGGETLIDKFHVPFLEHMFEQSNNPEEIILQYTTNATIKPNQKLIDFWKKCKSVWMEFSIDGIGETNDILRHPSKWNKVIETIDYFKSIEDVNFNFDINTVYQVGNALELADIINFSLDTIGKVPVISPIMGVDHLSIFEQEELVRFKIRDYLKYNVLNKFNEDIDGLCLYGISLLENPGEHEFTLEQVLVIEDKKNWYGISMKPLLDKYIQT